MQTSSDRIQRWFNDVWGSDPAAADAAIAEMLPENARFNGIGPAGFIGRDEFLKLRDHILKRYPDLTIDVEQMADLGDHVACHMMATGTHAETNTPVSFRGTALVRFENGAAVETWETWDFLSLMAQIGVVDVSSFAAELGPE